MALCRSILSRAKLPQSLRLCLFPSKRDHGQSSVGIQKEPSENYDVIIAGGGMVGCTLACCIARHPILSNLRVLLLEGGTQPQDFRPLSEFSNRVVSLNHNTKELLKSLHIWQTIEQNRVTTVKEMNVWEACSDALITFSDSDISMDVSHIVENNLLLYAINKSLMESGNSNIEIIFDAKISKCDLTNTNKLVELSTGEVFSARLLVGADGAKSQVRSAMGSQYLAWNYDQMGVVATLFLAEPSQNTTAWQRFLPTGPIALLPLNSEKSSLVWSTSVSHAKELLSAQPDCFVDAVNEALWRQYPRNPLVETFVSTTDQMLKQFGLATRQDEPRAISGGRVTPPSVTDLVVGSRAAFPLGFGHSTRYVGAGVALVGDAAHRVHPLAGQGVNLGFGDVKDLTELFANHLHRGQSLGNEDWLLEYEQRRQRHNVATQVAIEALHRIYTTDLTPLLLLRSVGLQITNALTPLKRAIMSHATH